VERLIDHVDDPRFWVTITKGLHPGLHQRGRIAGIDPRGLLGSPNKAVLFEEEVVFFAVRVHGVERGPIERTRRALHRLPFTAILRRELIPKGREIHGDAVGASMLPKNFGGKGTVSVASPALPDPSVPVIPPVSVAPPLSGLPPGAGDPPPSRIVPPVWLA